MNLEIDGKNIIVPRCTCGKCIIKRQRNVKPNFFPYNKNMGSTYSKDFDLKDSCSSPRYFNRSKRNGFDGSYKEHLPAGLMSTMKFDFKPFLIKLEETKSTTTLVESTPFFGRSSYNINFPSWGSASSGNTKRLPLPQINLPFRGNSNYLENYTKYEEEIYKNRDPIINNKSNLYFKGLMSPESTVRDAYRPIDLKQSHYFSTEKPKKFLKEKAVIIPHQYSKADFRSTYDDFYTENPRYNCELAMYLDNKGLKQLEI